MSEVQGKSSGRRGILIRASAEVLIIVLGVVLGLAVDRWARTLDDRAEEQALIEQLVEDVEADSLLYYRLSSAFAAQAHELEAVLRGIEDPAYRPDDAADFLGNLEGSAWWIRSRPHRETWDDIVASGRTRLLRDEELRRSLTRYYGEVSRLGEIESRWSQQFDRYWNEMSKVIAPLTRLAAVEAFTDPGAASPVGEQEVDSALKALREDASLRGSAGTVAILYRYGTPQYQAVHREAAEVLKLLRKR